MINTRKSMVNNKQCQDKAIRQQSVVVNRLQANNNRIALTLSYRVYRIVSRSMARARLRPFIIYSLTMQELASVHQDTTTGIIVRTIQRLENRYTGSLQ